MPFASSIALIQSIGRKQTLSHMDDTCQEYRSWYFAYVDRIQVVRDLSLGVVPWELLWRAIFA